MTAHTTQTVAELAARSLAAARVFEDHGIDFCCGGAKPVDQACREKGVDPDRLLAELEAAAKAGEPGERDWNQAPLAELAAHIVDRHHRYLKAELPRLSNWLTAVRKAHDATDGPTLRALEYTYTAMRDELEMHMQKEEMILFPAIQGTSSHPCFGSVANPIRVMEHEHDSAGRALREMRSLTSGYQAPPHACNTFRALYAGLAELEKDLHLHIHLENNILFPRALAAEGRT